MKLMEVCGTHTAGIFKSGLRDLLPADVRLVSGPGCPVCVTPSVYIDRCIDFAMRPNHVLVSFGDMLKVPGSDAIFPRNLDEAKGAGGRVQMVYSPFDVTELAQRSPELTFVIAAVGFETTVPAYAMLIEELIELKIKNVRLLTSLRSAVGALEWICENETGIDGFLCPGHVSVITGSEIYRPLAKRFNKPFVVGGFEPQHIRKAVEKLIQMVNSGDAESINVYAETVSEAGNTKAQAVIEKYFRKGDAVWRGLGKLGNSGFYLRDEYAGFDAAPLINKTETDEDHDFLPNGCRCSEVIMGRIDPSECALFATNCNPGSAIGPCMVSPEGACGIWYRYR